MSEYLMQLSYTTEAWAAMVKTPENRLDAVSQVVANLGGRIVGFWLAFGEHDLVGILEMPDNVSVAAFAMAISAGGAVKNVRTTPLMRVQEGMEAMRKAAACGYQPVTAKK
jgi:uncharacterized protein with GYD domain